ncbi:MAG: hypothetical protein LBM00_04415 [Deltaproteobacteria bacterium]|jgi:hypothetical protein|nr:hypothetical protein [Deltaproteobacteria bacterium]
MRTKKTTRDDPAQENKAPEATPEGAQNAETEAGQPDSGKTPGDAPAQEDKTPEATPEDAQNAETEAGQSGGGETPGDAPAQEDKTPEATPGDAQNAETETGQPGEGETPGDSKLNAAKAAAKAARESACQTAGAVKAKFKKAFASGSKNPAFITGCLDKLVKKLASLSACDCAYSNIPRVLCAGHAALLLLALISLVMGIVLGIRAGSACFLGYGLAAALLLLAAQYVAVKSFVLLEGIIENHPSKISGPALPEILAVLHLLGALYGAFMIVSGIAQGFLFIKIAYGILVLIILFLSAGLFTHADKLLNVQYDEKISLTEQLLGLLALLNKALVKLAPCIYSVGTAVMGALAIPPLVILLARGTAAWTSALQVWCLLASAVTFALTPLILYISAMLIQLVTDVLKSLLKVGNKE